MIGGRPTRDEIREDAPDQFGLDFIDDQPPILDAYPRGNGPPIHIPLALLAAILSRMRSPVTSRSNWAKDSRTLSISRPIEVVVLNCWVTETNDTLLPLEDFDQPGEVGQAAGQAVDLVDHHDVDLAGLDVGHQALQSGPIHIAAGEAGIDVVVGTGIHPSAR
jgi:hypothetical protein